MSLGNLSWAWAEGLLEWEIGKHPYDPWPDPIPTPTDIHDPPQGDFNPLQPCCAIEQSCPLLPSVGYPLPSMPLSPQAERAAEAKNLGQEGFCLQNWKHSACLEPRK